jgi:RNA polymerase primary sigma factor
MSEIINRLHKGADNFLRENGREPTPAEISARTGIDPEKVGTIMKMSGEPISLEMPISDGSFLHELLEDTEAVSPPEAATRNNLRHHLLKVLSTLTPQEEKVLRLRFGIDTSVDLTLEEVGRNFSVTRERIRQIEASALKKLKTPQRMSQLSGLLQ